mgnify:CR=1 FL=1
MDKIKVLVLFGGQSSEHEISELSVTNILSNMDERLEPYMVGITKEGQWFLYEGEISEIKECGWEKSDKLTPAILSPDAATGGLLVFGKDGRVRRIEIDVVYPALHGKFGEDGTVQGLLELAGIPYVGPHVAESAVSMDKTLTKLVADKAGVPQAAWELVLASHLNERMASIVETLEQRFVYPMFVKPAGTGSSVGVSKATDALSLQKALLAAAEYDEKVLVEEFIEGQEVECAVLGNEEPKTCVVFSHAIEKVAGQASVSAADLDVTNIGNGFEDRFLLEGNAKSLFGKEKLFFLTFLRSKAIVI